MDLLHTVYDLFTKKQNQKKPQKTKQIDFFYNHFFFRTNIYTSVFIFESSVLNIYKDLHWFVNSCYGDQDFVKNVNACKHISCGRLMDRFFSKCITGLRR